MLRLFLESCAEALWSGLASVARWSLRFVSADAEEQKAAQSLREEFQQIPEIGSQEPELGTGDSWQRNRLRLRKWILADDPRAFLTWDVIRETMFPPPHAAFARTELRALQDQNWELWQRAIKERAAGLPLPSLFQLSSSPNAIHHAYHLSRLRAETGVAIEEVRTVLEFGGGYGSMCRVAHQAGFAGNYVIFDFPEQTALQRYYFNRIGIQGVLTVSDLAELAGFELDSAKPNLFIATWSLSESPLEVRVEVAKAVAAFDVFLIAFQTEFGGIQNQPFFRIWQSWFPDVIWKSEPIEHIKGSQYLFGVSRRLGLG